MTQWTPELAYLIRKFSEYQDKQMKDALNPKSTIAGTTLRMIFRRAFGGQQAYKGVCKMMDLTDSLEPEIVEKNMQKMIDLAVQNNSNAADLLKKSLPVGQQLRKDFETHPQDFIGNLRIAKQKKLQY